MIIIYQNNNKNKLLLFIKKKPSVWMTSCFFAYQHNTLPFDFFYLKKGHKIIILDFSDKLFLE